MFTTANRLSVGTIIEGKLTGTIMEITNITHKNTMVEIEAVIIDETHDWYGDTYKHLVYSNEQEIWQVLPE